MYTPQEGHYIGHHIRDRKVDLWSRTGKLVRQRLSSKYHEKCRSPTLAIGTRIYPSRSPFHSNLSARPPIASAMSLTTVPRRVVGIRPLGPRKRASLEVI